MKKSEMYGQIFIYILTIVLVSVILTYGYKAIRDFNNTAKEISCLKLKNDLTGTVHSLLGDYGSVKIKNFRMCEGFSKVCFIETFDDSITIITDDPIIADIVGSNTKKNTFLIDKIADESYFIGNISVQPNNPLQTGVLCVSPISNNLRIRFESFGDHVDLSIP